MNLDQAMDAYRETYKWLLKVQGSKEKIRTNPDDYDVLMGFLAMYVVKQLPLIYVSSDVLSIVRVAAEQLKYDDLIDHTETRDVYNPFTRHKDRSQRFKVPPDSNLPQVTYTLFEHPISLGHETFQNYGLACFPYWGKDGAISAVKFGVYDRDAVAKAEHTEHLLSSRTGAPKLWLAPIDESEIEMVCKLEYALHQFSSQRLVQNGVGEPARHTRRRWTKEVDLPVPEIVYVHLRRVVHGSPKGSSSTVDWSHRWLVRGFWRNQWYASTQDHRPVWIASYVKGPDDKPLVVKDRVITMTR